MPARRNPQCGTGHDGTNDIDHDDGNGGCPRGEASGGRVSRTWPLATQAPFHLEATVRVLQRRPANPVDVWECGRYLRLLSTSEGGALVEVWNHGTVDAPDVRFAIRSGAASSGARREAGRLVRRILGLDVNPVPLQRAAEGRCGASAPERALRGLRPPRFADLFEAFANVVPFQQLSLDAGVAIISRLVAKFGSRIEHDGRHFHAFPLAQRVADAHPDALRACGLSARKAQVLRDLARLVTSGAITEAQLLALGTDGARAVLMDLPGIGPWSADLALLRGLGRIDVFPPGDAGAQRGLRVLMGLPSGAPLGKVIESFDPCRGYLYFLVLGGQLLGRRLIHAAPELARGSGVVGRRVRRSASGKVPTGKSTK